MKKVLFIDEDLEFGDVLKTFLNSFDIDLILKKFSNEVDESLNSAQFDLIIINIFSEPLNGISFSRMLRKTKTTLPIMIFSLEALDQKTFELFQNLKISYISKYSSPTRWLERIRGQFESKKS